MVAWKYAALVLFLAWITSGRDARAALPDGTLCYIVASLLAFYTLSSAMIGGLTADNLCAAAAEAALWAIGQRRDQRRARLAASRVRQDATPSDRLMVSPSNWRIAHNARADEIAAASRGPIKVGG